MSLVDTCTLVLELADAAGADKTYTVCPPFAGEWEVIAANFCPSSAGAVAIDGTDYRTLTLSSAGTTVGTMTTNTGGTAWTANTPAAFTISAVALATGNTDAISVASVKTGSTGKVANGNVCITLKRVRI